MTGFAVVIPTIREDCFALWQEAWAPDLAGNARVIVVEDGPQRSFGVGNGWDHCSWAEIDADLGEKAWIIPRRTSAIRSYGFWKAWQGGADYVWTLDDDCHPEQAWRGRYLGRLETILGGEAGQDEWHNTIRVMQGAAPYPRGFPYGIRDQRRPVAVHHGLWSNIPDLDGRTQLAEPLFRLPPAGPPQAVPYGQFFPMSGMNLAFRRDLAPAMYFMLMGEDYDGKPWGFHRFDDIWAGLMVKRICDHLGFAVTSGGPSVHHSRASDPERNAVLEAPGIEAHEGFWKYIQSRVVDESTVADCYQQLAHETGFYRVDDGEPYWEELGEAMTTWAGLFE